MTNFRTGIMKIAPPWLLGPIGERLLYSIALPMDGLVEWVFQGIQARFPLVGTPDALGPIGRDRRIVRGFDESDASYAFRLVRWLDDWRAAGSAYSLMRQVQGYLKPHAVRLRTVDNHSNWYTLNADGTIEFVRAANWDWDTHAERWNRFWLIIYPPADLWTAGPDWNTAPLWGGAWGTDGYTWGTTATPKQVATVRAIVSQWKPAHAVCQNIIIAFDAASFDPSASPGPPLPDGLWGQWSKDVGGVRVASRLSTARYWDGV